MLAAGTRSAIDEVWLRQLDPRFERLQLWYREASAAGPCSTA